MRDEQLQLFCQIREHAQGTFKDSVSVGDAQGVISHMHILIGGAMEVVKDHDTLPGKHGAPDGAGHRGGCCFLYREEVDVITEERIRQFAQSIGVAVM